MRRWILLALASFWLWPSSGAAVERDDFLIVDAQDVVDVCTVPESDALYAASIAFCHGYLVGAYQYHLAIFGHGKSHPVVCLPEPVPTRTQAVEKFIAWLKANPQYLKDKAPDAITRYLVETYPCKAPEKPAQTGGKKK
ncbi:hypothetical protein K2Z84_32265 [Candidatus Binatia bacterium]|jgi:hypothetical protein|nr:hypothetical protein [Candidatus Binatia bacterium]